MTLSVRASMVGGIVMPICFAVFRLTTISNFLSCSTSRSVGFVPFRILSTYVAARCMSECWAIRSRSLTIQTLDETASIEFPDKALIRDVLESQFCFGAGGDLIDHWLDPFSRGVWGRSGFIGIISVSLFQHRRLIFSQVSRHNVLAFGHMGFEILNPFHISADKSPH